MRAYILHLLIAIDQLVNALLAGAPDETLSARAWRTEVQGRVLGRVFRPLIDLIFWPVQRQHCRAAYMAELSKKQLPRGY